MPDNTDNWSEVTKQLERIDQVNVPAISAASQQFAKASENADDHNTSLTNSVKALRNGVWEGEAANGFFAYVDQVTTAGDKVRDHLKEVSKDLDDLATQLSDIKNQVSSKAQDAEKEINARNAAAKTKAEAMVKDDPAAASGVITAAGTANHNTAHAAAEAMNTLLQTADQKIAESQKLMKTQIEGGYSSVPLPGKDGTLPQQTGGIHSNGASHNGGGGGSSGGGGGLGPSGAPPSTTPPGNVQQWIQEAIKILQANGIPVTDADISKIWTIIEKESGGNPNAINNWDSNAAKGTPSKGLMQCIDPTFNAHKLPGHDNIYNPVDNIIAGVRYTFSRYGGFDGHPGLKSMSHGGGYQGY
ncbi:WXG100 family type VII secretion target [Amycolatopsis xylanica]|uniref:WXG100 family type VII secretion target n=1 Tax=Amycolatopsis xylanica TaxID=589385 RepID=A0A1H2ZYL4_9PSEU|nr:transglycosylase SLT domain-containing protein [Amycolatopsis xylanica]SDX22505.1 WXG100 family type VII secretion target [Amycolatopsis xylanica]